MSWCCVTDRRLRNQIDFDMVLVNPWGIVIMVVGLKWRLVPAGYKTLEGRIIRLGYFSMVG